MNRLLAAMGSLALLSASLLAQALPCVPRGGGSITLRRPPLNGAGMPVTAEWVGQHGDPVAEESDAFSNDPMGPATPDQPPTSASIRINNTSGTLVAPNGTVLNGGLEGDCIEVVMCWTYRYHAMVTSSRSTATDGASVTTSVSTIIWKIGRICTGEHEVCPCP